MLNRKLQVTKYLIVDYLSALLAWSIFFVYRKYYIDPYFFEHISIVLQDTNFQIGIIVIPFFWLFLYILMGAYRRIYRKSRLRELGQTLTITIIGVTIIFFVLILDDFIVTYKSYYQSFLILFALHFILTYIPRLILTTRAINKLRKRKIGFRTIIVGSNGNAENIYHEIEDQLHSPGNKFIGFVSAMEMEYYPLEDYLPHLGSYKDLNQIIEQHKVDEIIIAIERSEKNTVDRIISEIQDTNVVIKVIPEMQDILMGTVRTSAIFSPLIEIAPDPMPAWQMFLKRGMDIVISIIAIIILIPAYIFTAIGVRRSSPGSIIYTQMRVGKNGKYFPMHKFRSMYQDAERGGKPMLSSQTDPRITPFGRFMRKVRLDEIPQFYSVLKGDMSLVGPRPERQYFIDRICEKAPEYRLLQRIKPGITSWGQVRFGYAENVEEMIARLKYDLLYLENMSIAMDIKIMIYTVLIVIQGRGK